MLLFVLILLLFDHSHRITFQHHGQSRAEPDPHPFLSDFLSFSTKDSAAMILECFSRLSYSCPVSAPWTELTYYLTVI